MESASRPPGLAARFAHTLVYWPFEDQHAGESAALAWILILSCLVLGLVASFQNLLLGVGFAASCLYGSALARYLVTR